MLRFFSLMGRKYMSGFVQKILHRIINLMMEVAR